MKNLLTDVEAYAFSKLIHRPGPNAYLGIGVVSALVVVVWTLFSSLEVADINGWLPYHVPVSIFLSLILLILALRGWMKILLGGEPAASLAEAAPQQGPEAQPRIRFMTSLVGQPPRVLVVDDDPAIRMVLCKKLSLLGVRPTPACDGLEALLAVADRRWDMILIDGEMPVMDGIEATREIRCQHLVTDQTPIIGITSNQGGAYRQKCLAAGMNACLPKPRHTEDLAGLLDEFLVSGSLGGESAMEGGAKAAG